jgi:hypothetical protein
MDEKIGACSAMGGNRQVTEDCIVIYYVGKTFGLPPRFEDGLPVPLLKGKN